MAPVVQVWAAALLLKIAAPKLALTYDSPTIVTVREVMWPKCCSYRFNAFFQKRRWREGGKDENSDVQVRQPDQKIGYGEVPHLETRGYNAIQSESLHLKCLPKKLDSSVQLVNRVWELDLHCSPGSCYSSLTWWCSCGWKRPEWGRQWAEGRAALTLKWYGQNSVTKKVESHRQLSAQCWREQNIYTWNKERAGVKPVELQVETEANGFDGDQNDEVYDWYGSCENTNTHTNISTLVELRLILIRTSFSESQNPWTLTWRYKTKSISPPGVGVQCRIRIQTRRADAIKFINFKLIQTQILFKIVLMMNICYFLTLTQCF